MFMTIIVCPACYRKYAIDLSGNSCKSKKMRCCKCSHEWIFKFNEEKNEKLSTKNVDNLKNSFAKERDDVNVLKNNEPIVSHGTLFQNNNNKIPVDFSKKVHNSIVKSRFWTHVTVMSCMMVICCIMLSLIFYEELPASIHNPVQKNLAKIGINGEKIKNFQLENVDIQQDLTGKIKIAGKIRNLTAENHYTPKLRLILKDRQQKKKIINLKNEGKIIEHNGWLGFAYEIFDIDADEAIIELGNSLSFVL